MDFQLTEEQQAIKKMVQQLAQKELAPRAAEWEKTGEFPWPNIKKLAELGVMGITIPEEYGGVGGSLFEAVLVLEEIGKACYHTAMAVLGEVGVQTQILVHYGSDSIKNRFLPRIARGEAICAICMTEPDAGSDVSSIATTVTRDGDHYLVNGSKIFISRATVAEVFVVFARFDGVPGSDGIGAVVIENTTPGFQVARIEETMGGDPLGELVFNNCRIPEENILLKEKGFKKLMSAFNGQRCLNAAISLGIAQGAFDEALKYAQQRRQFGREICEFQGIQWMLADMATKLESARLLIYRAATNAGLGFPNRMEAAMAKVVANEIAIQVTNDAMQIHGTYGYSKDFPVERMLRTARFGALGGGTTQIQRNIIARLLLDDHFANKKKPDRNGKQDSE